MIHVCTRTSATILRDVLVSLALVLVAFVYFSRYCDNSLFTSDAADYLRTANCRFSECYLDTRSVGLWGAITVIRAHPQARSHLWDYFDRQNDAGSSRHWHVAFGFYPTVIVLGWTSSSRAQRLVMAAEGSLAVGVVYAGLRLASVDLALSLLAAFFTLLSPSIVSTATNVSPHAVFMISMLVAAFSFAHYLATKHRFWAIMAAAAFAIAAATLELSIVIALAFLIVVAPIAYRRGARGTLRAITIPGLVFIAVLIIAWPGGIMHGSYVLSYGTFIFQALFRRDLYFGHASLATTILRAGQGSLPVVIFLMIMAVGAIGLFRRQQFTFYLRVFSWLTLGFLAQGLLNHFANSTYLAHFTVLSWILCALCVQRWLDTTAWRTHRKITAGVAASAVALLGFAAYQWPSESSREMHRQAEFSGRAGQVIDFAKRSLPRGAVVVSNYGTEIWRYYLPENRFEYSANVFNLAPRAWVPLTDYWVIADPELLDPSWKQRLKASSGETIAGFVISSFRNE